MCAESAAEITGDSEMKKYSASRREENKLTADGRKYRLKNSLIPHIMQAPAMIVLVLFTFIPMLYLIYISFFSYDLITDMKFVGVDNYNRLFTIELQFWNSLWNTVVYSAAIVVFLILFALLLSIWMQEDSRLNAFAQRLMFLPHLCSGVAIALVFQWLMDDEGLINTVLNFLSLPAVRWLNDSSVAMISVIIVSLWKNMGYYALILLASLKAIPAEINEAATLDNTSPLRRFFRITLPMVSPQLFFLVVTITINSFKVFESVRILTGGGPGDATNVLVFYIYKKAFSGQVNLGLASAAGVVLMAILMVLTVLYFKLLDRKVHYQ